MINIELFEDAVHTTLHLDPETLSVSVTEMLDGGTGPIIRQRSLGHFDFAETFWLFRGDAELFESGEIPAVIRELNQCGFAAANWSVEEFRNRIFSKFLTATRA